MILPTDEPLRRAAGRRRRSQRLQNSFVMDEKQFRRQVRELGYDEPRVFELPPGADGEMHVHEFSSFGLVIRGQARIQFEGHLEIDNPGDCTEVPAGVLHCEKAGEEGATVLLAFKTARDLKA